MASFVNPGTTSTTKRKELSNALTIRYKQDDIHAFVQIKEAETVISGMLHMIEHHGLGPLVPNTIVFGGIRKEDESIDFANLLRMAYKRHFNVVILNESSQLEAAKGKNIHIWLDDRHQNNSELMLVLGYMLQLNPGLKRSRLCARAIVSSELERQEKLRQLNQISLEKRLPMDAEVYISTDHALDQIELIHSLSKDADMIFLGLKPPPKDVDALEDYVAYLHGLSQTFEGAPLVLVLSSESTPLNSILE